MVANFRAALPVNSSLSFRQRLLLAEAVDRAHAPDERFGVDGDNAAVGEKLLQNLERAGVVRVAEDGDEDDAVGDQEVGVTGG